MFKFLTPYSGLKKPYKEKDIVNKISKCIVQQNHKMKQP